MGWTGFLLDCGQADSGIVFSEPVADQCAAALFLSVAPGTDYQRGGGELPESVQTGRAKGRGKDTRCASDGNLDTAHGMRAAGKDITFFDVLFADASRMHHMHLA